MDKWLLGVISKNLGDLHYEIEFRGKFFKRHIDQVRAAINDVEPKRSSKTTQHNHRASRPCDAADLTAADLTSH